MAVTIEKLTSNSRLARQYGFERAPDLDFTDDGNRFTGYTWKGKVPLTQCTDSTNIYLSVDTSALLADKNIPYEFWSKYPEYELADEFNGVPKPIDIEKLAANCEAVWNSIQKAHEDFKNTGYPDLEAHMEDLENAIMSSEELLKQDTNWFELGFSEKGVAEAFRLYKNLKASVKRDTELLKSMKDKTLVKSEAYRLSQLEASKVNRSVYYLDHLLDLINGNGYEWYYSKIQDR